MLERPDEQCRQDENDIMKRLISCVGCQQSLIFNAGAGAGKTYALVECLKYICTERESILKYHNQKAICITYTNVAANEIKDRIGSTDLVLISTIHERIWEIIKDYQEELVEIHLSNLQKQIMCLRKDIDNEATFTKLQKNQRNELENNLIEKQQEFYKIYDSDANTFRAHFANIFPNFREKIGNVGNFKKACSQIIRISEYERCVVAINNGEVGYKEVRYDARNNRDYLQYMKISHETLLEYAFAMIDKYNQLKRTIIDKYPYIFIDECQDTNENVVKIFTTLEEYSKKIKHPFFIGYFGDAVQNIYDDGIGSGLDKYCKDYECIIKPYNRRSCEEIIALCNRIRNDNMIQRSIYEDAQGGSVQVYYGTEENIKNFVCVKSEELQCMSRGDKTVHCFLLLNRVVADYAGLTELYNWFKETPFYRKNFNAITTELLSNDVNKLGEIQRYLYNMTEFYLHAHQGDTSLLEILPTELFALLDIEDASKIVAHLKNMSATTLRGLLQKIEEFKRNITSDLVGKKNQLMIEHSIDEMTGIEHFNMDRFCGKVKEVLFQGDQIVDKQIDTFLDFDMDLLSRWCQYVDRDYVEDVVYHTFHSTKGLEFDNVIIVFDDSFGRDTRFFAPYFEEYDNELTDHSCKSEKYTKARNLLYVAATRARINLRILYTGDYQSKKDVFDTIFGNVQQWKDT